MTITIMVASGSVIPHEDGRMRTFLETLMKVHEKTALISFSCTQQLGDSKKYGYQFAAQDGRMWSQVIHIEPPDKTTMTFNVPQHWGLEEFTPHRDLRDQVIDLVDTFKVTSLSVTWS